IKSYLVSKAKDNAARYKREARQHAKAGNDFKAGEYLKYAQGAARRAVLNERKPIKGVQRGIYTSPEFLATLGLRIKAEVHRPGMTMKTWCRVREKWTDKGTWLITNCSHALVY